MQNAAFAAAALRGWRYETLDVSPADLPAAVNRLREADVAGANVTIPHKTEVVGLVDELDPQARNAGAVNTVVNDGGRLLGSNTDVAGIAAALSELDVPPGPGLRVLILGGGGSARAAAAAVESDRVVFAVRRPAGVAELPGQAVPWTERADFARDSDLVINATPLGREGEVVLETGDLPRVGAV